MKRTRFATIFFGIVGLLFSAGSLQAQTVAVQLKASYTARTSGNPNITVYYGDPLVNVAGSGDQETAPGSFSLTLDQPLQLGIRAEDLLRYRVSFTPPPQYGLIVEKVRRTSIGFEDGPTGVGVSYINVTLVRRGATGAGNSEPLGSTGSILRADMSGTDLSSQAPALKFNLGLAANGTALPPLRIALLGRNSSSDEIVVPDAPDLDYSPSAGAFELTTPQVHVKLELDTSPNFYLKFFVPGATTEFLSYYFEFSGTNPRTAKVTKTFTGGSSYETTWTGSPFAHNGSWTADDWHIVSAPVLRTMHGERFTENIPGVGLLPDYTPVFSSVRLWEIVETKEGTTLSSKTRFDYRKLDYYSWDENANVTGVTSVIQLAKVTEGVGDGDYVTQTVFAAALSPDVIGTKHPTGAVQIDGNAGPIQTAPNTYTWSKINWDSWLDTTSSVDANGVFTSAVGAHTNIDYETDSRWIDFQLPTAVVRKVGETEVSRSQFSYSDATANGQTLLISTRTDFEAYDTAGPVTVTKRYRPDSSDTYLRDRIYSIAFPNGTKQSFAYERGTFVPSTNAFTVGATGTDLRISTLNGVAASTSGSTNFSSVNSVAVDTIGLVDRRSTKTVEILQSGFVVRRESWVYADSDFELLNFAKMEYTVAGELSRYETSSGLVSTATWASGLKTEETSETGVTTTYGYDSMGRITSVDREGSGTAVPDQHTEFVYDSDNRIRFTKVGPDSSEHKLVTEQRYDLGGRVKKTIAPGGVTTDVAYALGGRQVTTTYASGATKVATAYIDGKTKSVTGSAVVAAYQAYDFDSLYRLVCTTNTGSTTGRSQVCVYDLLGRVVEESADGFGSGGATHPIVKGQSYNSKGQLIRTRTFERSSSTEKPLSADSLFYYDLMGQVNFSGLDVDGSGLAVSSSDRCVSTENSFAKDTNSVWWARTLTHLYYAHGSSASRDASALTRLSGLGSGLVSQTVATDFYGNKTTTSVSVYPSTKLTQTLVEHPDGTRSVSTQTAGMKTSDQSFTDAATIAAASSMAVTYTYDDFGRQSTSTDPRGIVTQQNYYADTSRVSEVYSGIDPLTSIAIRVSAFTYDSAGRLETTTDAKSVSTTVSYNSRDQIVDETGQGTYPVHHVYNEYGQQTELWTWRSNAGTESAASKTIWAYDAATGWPVSKTDAAGKAVTYDYVYDFTHGTKNVTRTWARGSSTTSKFSLSTGDLVRVEYSDSTPAVDYTYTRTGQIESVTDITGTRDFAYDREQLSAEAFDTDTNWYHGLVLSTLRQDATTGPHTLLGRYRGFALGTTSVADAEMSVAFGYDEFGRIGGLTAAYKAQGSRAALSTSFSYEYKAGTSLWEQLTHAAYSVTREFEDGRDVLTSITAQNGSAFPISQHTYKTNNAGERVSSVQLGSAFGDFDGATSFKYAYDDRGQLENAAGYLGDDPDNTSTRQALPGRGFQFTYDSAGNRQQVTVDSEQVDYTGDTSESGANKLNQVKHRGTLRTRVSGTADASATVVVDGHTVTSGERASRYWDTALSTFGEYRQINFSSSVDGSGSRYALTRPSLEDLEYDDDGNLTRDGLWAYTWDAENRLTRIATRNDDFATLGYSTNPPAVQIDFAYDYLGRRVSKIVVKNSTTTYNRRFVYDGWNLIAEIDPSTQQITRSYTWGLDVASSLTATGGVGALVLETAHTSTTLTTYDIACDGNGNITALAATATGTLAAAYEYDPFGQLLRIEGTEAANNPFRFSSKFTDHESGLVYYGHRYYDSSLGRFINRDPAEEEGGVNLYGFVKNNPTNLWDYLGRNPPDNGNAIDVPGSKGEWTRGADGSISATYKNPDGSSERFTFNPSDGKLSFAKADTDSDFGDARQIGTYDRGNGAFFFGSSTNEALNTSGKGEVGTYLVRLNANGEWEVVGKTNGVTTEYAFVNGILGTLGRHAYLGGKHLQAMFGKGVTEFTLFNNPSKGFLKDIWESGMDKLGITSAPAKALAGVLQEIEKSGNSVQWIAHSQGGAIFSEAMSYARDHGSTSLSTNSVVFDAGANNHWVTDEIAASLEVHIGGYYYSSWDAVPNVLGLNGNPLTMIGSVFAAPLLFTKDHSPHTEPTAGWSKRW